MLKAIIKLLFGLGVTRKTITDETLGKIEYISFKSPSYKYENCELKYNFKPTESLIGVSFSCGVVGPTLSQKEFLKSIESQYDSLVTAIQTFYKNEIENTQLKVFDLDLKKDFKLTSISITGDDRSTGISWSLYFDSTHNKKLRLDVSFFQFNIEELSLAFNSKNAS